VLKFAKENKAWGYQRIQSIMTHLGYKISRTAVYRIMKDAGVNPDPKDKKKTTWAQFIKTHMHVMAATDFFHVEVLTKRGPVRCSILFFIELNSRRVHMSPAKINPTSEWVDQHIKNYVNFDQGLFDNRKYLIHDRDPLFMAETVQNTLETSGVKSVKTAPFSPDQNSFAESFVAGCRKEMFDKVIFTSKEQLDYAIASYQEYHNRWKPHQGLDGKLIDPLPQDEHGEIACQEFMGGLLKGYRRVKKRPDIAA
jgi:hypothetical protein